MDRGLESAQTVAEPEDLRSEHPEFSSEEEWDAFEEETFGDFLHPVDQQSVEDHHVMWRGMDPDDVLDFLGGEQQDIAVHGPKNRANATSRWREAITYAGKSDRPFTMALGFLPDGRRMKVKRVDEDEEAETEAVRSLHQAHYILDGKVQPEDTYYLVVRFAGEEGNPNEPRFYAIDQKAFAARHAPEADEAPLVS